jgi:hypothetical protein
MFALLRGKDFSAVVDKSYGDYLAHVSSFISDKPNAPIFRRMFTETQPRQCAFVFETMRWARYTPYTTCRAVGMITAEGDNTVILTGTTRFGVAFRYAVVIILATLIGVILHSLQSPVLTSDVVASGTLILVLLFAAYLLYGMLLFFVDYRKLRHRIMLLS